MTVWETVVFPIKTTSADDDGESPHHITTAGLLNPHIRLIFSLRCDRICSETPLVNHRGIEPRTYGLKARYSTC